MKYKIELTEEQLMLMANCVEDCHRFAAGQAELINTTSRLRSGRLLQEKLQELEQHIVPELERGASYDWSGRLCPNKYQREFIANTYYLYREIYHQVITERCRRHGGLVFNVYLGETLRCKDSGEIIKVTPIEE